jgi:hypothetical protein
MCKGGRWGLQTEDYTLSRAGPNSQGISHGAIDSNTIP